ncbi:MAG: hypothetical protein DRR16_22815 [Candidatus Parabeggiatoa sp. nov. 3]|jgi:hypothetical protein|nr:MAG: hypothetical protein DRR00_10090 [Gammaproteobacteria bacterium]RKZ68488.1 MAG: hypothetical protein DRQ99_03700 [Gammaproteobacteria bacterium]RKZ81039.1 MAG: hypothetical protein DRR16_22815 [Gammaproteobacteria bacterium]
MTALAKLPLNQARQEVLDLVPKMIIKCAFQHSVSFLRKVVENYANGEFTNLMNAHFVMNGALI